MSQVPHPPLPPGWEARWDPTANRHAFIETASGRSQYNFPSANGPPPVQRAARGHAVRASISGPITNTSPSHQRFHSVSGTFNPHHFARPNGASPQSSPIRPNGVGTASNGSPARPTGGPPPPQPSLGPASPIRQPPSRGPTPLASMAEEEPAPAQVAPTGPPPPPASAAPAAEAPARVIPRSRRQYAANTRQYIAGEFGGGSSGPPPVTQRGHGYSQSVSVTSNTNNFFSPSDPIAPLAAPFGGPTPGTAPAYGGAAQPAPGPAQAQFGGVPPVADVTSSFGQMGLGGAQKQAATMETVNLMNLALNPAELHELPTPEINLPPNASFSQCESRNADPSYQRSTLNAIPTSASLLAKSKVPLALILTPYRSIQAGDAEVPVATDTVIARCRRCRTYINPYVTFVEGGQRWKCCMCNLSNEVPQLFDWDQDKNQPADRYARPELNHSVVEFVAPTEYMIRPPQPPLYIFILDVSYAAVTSGMLATAARTLLESLERLPNDDDRTKIAIIGVDSCLHFYTLPPGEAGESGVLVVGDLDDVFLPQPTDILVNLVEAKNATEGLLERMSDMYANTHNVGHALGPALQAAFKLLSNVGGKVIALSATLPNLGPGALKNREDSKALGTSKESTLLQAASSWYKNFAIECSRSQISVDLWLFSSAYTDVATLSGLPRYTGGNTYFYPSFNASRSEDALKFAHEFGTVIADPTPFEAVIRVRASRGIRMSAFHGNFFVRSTDLLSLASVPMDQSYAIELQIDDPITLPFVVLQTAVLHTTAFGERRIRVITQALPTTSSLSEVYGSVDQIAVATLLANKAVEKTMTTKLEDARELVKKSLVDILGTYKATMTSASGPSPQLVAAGSMKFLPLLIHGLNKNIALRHSTVIPSDMRSYAQCLISSLPSQRLIPYLHPVFYSLHNMPKECGTIGDHGVVLPVPLPLSSERLERHGLFLIEDGQNIFLWLGRDAVPQLVKDVFNVNNYADMRAGKWTLPQLDNSFSQRVNAIVGKVREHRRGPYWPHLYVVKEDGEASLRQWALSMLIEDRMDGLNSYQQWLGTLKDAVNNRSF